MSPLWWGETWTCPACGWVNAIIRKRCRNFDCVYRLDETYWLQGLA